MFDRSRVVVFVLTAAAWMLAGCGDSAKPRQAAAEEEKPTLTQNTQPKELPRFQPRTTYSPGREGLIERGDDLYMMGKDAFNRWGTTGERQEIKDALRYLNESFDKYREAKDEYGDDAILRSKFKRMNALRYRVMKCQPL